MDDWSVDSIKAMRTEYMQSMQDVQAEKSDFDNMSSDEKMLDLLTTDSMGICASTIESLKIYGAAETDQQYVADAFAQKGLTITDQGFKWSITIPD